MIDQSQLEQLNQTEGAHLVSIYMKTQRVANNEGDRIRLKNQLKAATHKLEARGLEPRDIEALLQSATDLLDNPNFWQNRSDGLALFIGDGAMQTYDVPVHFDSKVYVGNRFHISPLIPTISGQDRFFLLSLNLNDIAFFDCTRNSISPVIIEDLLPTSLHEKLAAEGATFPGDVQHHSGQGRGNAIFHGHGDQDSTQEKAREFFRLVDEGLMTMLHDERAPMLLAGTTERVSLYKEVSNYPHIVDDYVSGNLEHLDAVSLHNLAWEKMGPMFQEKNRTLRADFGTYLSEGRGSFNVLDIVPKAINGRVENLFVEESAETWGAYNWDTNTVEIHEKQQPNSIHLEDLAARKVWEQGGVVHIVPREELIKPVSNMNATYRY